mmetsp:Transcript_127/g.475  ORF Transcript_127/g.475 Transcript_127/m.475 type:complete len:217 (-) Transcript_127:120-770(-)
MLSTSSTRMAPAPKRPTAFTASAISFSTSAFLGAAQYPPTLTNGTQNSANVRNSATARAVTRSYRSLCASSRAKSSARAHTTSTLVKPSSRATTSRNVVRFRSVSNNVNLHCGRAMASGMPGNPAPLPTSITRLTPPLSPSPSCNKASNARVSANASPTCASSTSSTLVAPVSIPCSPLFSRISSSAYARICARCASVNARVVARVSSFELAAHRM